MIATSTTRFFITRTARLRAAVRQVDPYSAAAGAVLALIVAVGLSAPAPTVAPAATPAPTPALAPIRIPGSSAGGLTHPAVRRPSAVRALATAAPTPAAPTAAPAIAAEQPAITVQRAPQATPAGYVAHTTAGDVFVPDSATPVPNDGSYAGPYLAPAATAEAPAQPRLCTGFGDWRDYDPMYASSPQCQPVAP